MRYQDEYDSAGWEYAKELAVKLREAEARAAEGWQRASELDANRADGWQRALELDVRVRELEAALTDQRTLFDAATYFHNGLGVWSKVAPFLGDERFRSAYDAGMATGHHMGRPKGSREDIHIEWRVHTICWAAAHAARLDGDFVECGVNTGLYALAVCRYVDFNRLDRDFWLFDTYRGAPLELASDAEVALVAAENEALYEECYELTRGNFADYPRARLVRGVIPDTLPSVTINRVAFLSIDLGLAAAERAALEHFWPKLVAGASVVLDDYGWVNRAPLREAIDAFAQQVGVEILVSPTGQGVLIKS